jgi:hypothetical protein
MRAYLLVYRLPVRLLGIAALLAMSAGGARADSITVASDYQGYVSSEGYSDGVYNRNQTYTGNASGDRYNSWASFDLTSLNGTVTGATLDIILADWMNPTPDTLGIYDVSTPLPAFGNQTAGIAGYKDLGSGNLYGTVTGSQGEQFVSLSSQAIADINAAKGKTFLVGFTNFTLNGQDPYIEKGIYTNGWVSGYPQLILTTGVAAPEPASWILFGLGVLGLAGCGRWRRTRGAIGARCPDPSHAQQPG